MKNTATIKNIVFDLGGVIVDLDIKSTLAAFARLGMMPQGVTPEMLMKGSIPDNWEINRIMHAMDMGEMDREKFLAVMRPGCRPGVTDSELLAAMNSILVFHRHRLEWLQQLRRRYRVFLLSNIGDVHWTETLQRTADMGIPIGECFDEVFLSYRLHMAKPDPRIFRHLIQETGIVPGETLYIDDLPANIEAGNEAGLLGRKIDSNRLDEVLPELFPELVSCHPE